MAAIDLVAIPPGGDATKEEIELWLSLLPNGTILINQHDKIEKDSAGSWIYFDKYKGEYRDCSLIIARYYLGSLQSGGHWLVS